MRHLLQSLRSLLSYEFAVNKHPSLEADNAVSKDLEPFHNKCVIHKYHFFDQAYGGNKCCIHLLRWPRTRWIRGSKRTTRLPSAASTGIAPHGARRKQVFSYWTEPSNANAVSMLVCRLARAKPSFSEQIVIGSKPAIYHCFLNQWWSCRCDVLGLHLEVPPYSCLGGGEIGSAHWSLFVVHMGKLIELARSIRALILWADTRR